nr:MAG TPA: hypothetical protein [Caudoviricetes sp.]
MHVKKIQWADLANPLRGVPEVSVPAEPKKEEE